MNNKSSDNRIDVLGVGFSGVTLDAAISRANAILNSNERVCRDYVVTPNPEIVLACRENPDVARAVNAASLVLPDGVGVLYAAKILRKPLYSRVTGIDFISGLFEKHAGAQAAAPLGAGSEAPLRVFLLGAKPGVAETAGLRISEKYPSLEIAGTADGYFSADSPVIDAINAASADLLLVCLGAPKQELWISEHIGQLNIKLAVCLGGVLDVFAGTAKRAPVWMQKAGLEWLYRLCREPRRIVRISKLPFFLLLALKMRISKTPDNTL